MFRKKRTKIGFIVISVEPSFRLLGYAWRRLGDAGILKDIYEILCSIEGDCLAFASKILALLTPDKSAMLDTVAAIFNSNYRYLITVGLPMLLFLWAWNDLRAHKRKQLGSQIEIPRNELLMAWRNNLKVSQQGMAGALKAHQKIKGLSGPSLGAQTTSFFKSYLVPFALQKYRDANAAELASVVIEILENIDGYLKPEFSQNTLGRNSSVCEFIKALLPEWEQLKKEWDALPETLLAHGQYSIRHDVIPFNEMIAQLTEKSLNRLRDHCTLEAVSLFEQAKTIEQKYNAYKSICGDLKNALRPEFRR